MGDLILDRSRELVSRVKSLLQEIDSLIERFEDLEVDCSLEIDWASYKRSERTLLKKERWEKARRKRERIRALRPLYRSGRGVANQSIKVSEALVFLVRPFSPMGQSRQAFREEFATALKSEDCRRFPWRQHIIRELLLGRTTLSTMSPVLIDRRGDTTLRFQTLVEMSHEGQVTLNQDSSFGRIRIKPEVDRLDPTVELREPNGVLHRLSWTGLSDRQRGKIRDDLALGRIVLARR